MREFVFDLTVMQEYARIIASMTNDPKDRHVLAAAVVTGAQVIVTSNVSDFPQLALAPYQIEAQHPDVFLEHLLDLDEDLMIHILREQAQALRRPAMSIEGVLTSLALHAPNFARRVLSRLGST